MIPNLEEHPEIRELITASENVGRYVHRTREEVRDSIFSEGLYCTESFYSTASFLSKNESEALRSLMGRHSGSTAHIILDIPHQVRQITRQRIQNTPGVTILALDPAYFYNDLIPPQLVYGSFNPDTLEITLNPNYNPNHQSVLIPKFDEWETKQKATQNERISQTYEISADDLLPGSPHKEETITTDDDILR